VCAINVPHWNFDNNTVMDHWRIACLSASGWTLIFDGKGYEAALPRLLENKITRNYTNFRKLNVSRDPEDDPL